MFRQNGPLEIEGKADGVPVPVTISGGGGVSHVIVDSGDLQTVGALGAIVAALPAGANVIGHVIADGGSTTVVTGNVTVVQPTGTNLHAVTDTGSTTSVSAIVGALPAGANVIGHVISDTGSTTAVTGTVDENLKQINGHTVLEAGVNGTLAVGGAVATNVASPANPVNLGAQAVSSENTAVTATRLAQLVTDLVGKLIVLPYANPENFVRGAITSAMSGTTSTLLLAAPAGALRNYVTQITVSNAHATVGTDLIVQDGSGGTTLYTIPAAALYGGASVSFPVPLRQPTAATGLYIQNVTTGSSTKASASGYTGL